MEKLSNIGVVGSGTMGNGIAHIFSLFNYNVLLVDINESILNKGIKTITNNMKRQVNKGVINNSHMDKALNRISIGTNMSLLSNCDIIVEAASENENIKLKIFKDLDFICKTHNRIHS